MALFVVAAVACARNVKQDAKSGPDAKYKGAKSIKLQNNQGEASGIVTYPGGDRVDWKLVEIPATQSGKLEIELSWKPPRPGLDLSVDVYNEYGRKLGGTGAAKKAKKSKKKKNKNKRSKKSLTIEGAKGKIYLEVYASTRGDAGKYKVKVKFAEEVAHVVPVFDPGTVEIPQPPKLASVPLPCDENNIDPKNPECKGMHPPCDPKAPDDNNPRCKGVKKPCDPQLLDPLNPACLPYYPDCDPLKIDPKNPKCQGVTKPPAEPLEASIVAVDPASSGTIITINRGTKDGIDTKWTGDVVDSTGRVVSQGGFKVYKVQAKQCFAKVKLSKSQIDKTPQVKLYPPS
jgi:hypothetical protein